jgi:hypothetical protein
MGSTPDRGGASECVGPMAIARAALLTMVSRARTNPHRGEPAMMRYAEYSRPEPQQVADEVVTLLADTATMTPRFRSEPAVRARSHDRGVRAAQRACRPASRKCRRPAGGVARRAHRCLPALHPLSPISSSARTSGSSSSGVAIESFQRLNTPNMQTTPRISTISASLQSDAKRA